MTDHLPYVPDIDRLLNTLRKMDASQIGDWEGDSYATFWVKENAAVLSGDNYIVAASFLEVASNEKEDALNAFWK